MIGRKRISKMPSIIPEVGGQSYSAKDEGR